jgi:hypothetical protein
MPYEGGCVANLGGNCTRGRVISAEATRNRWLQANGLTGTTPTQQVVNLDANDGGPANRFDYTGAIPLRWWRLDGAGHTVASRTVLVEPNATTGIQSRDIEFAEVAWEFFNERLTNAAAAPTSSALEAARSYNFAMGGQSLIIMHRGEVLLEAYANGGAIDRAQLLASATKGFTGMIGAIAASEGLFDLDEPVSQRALTEWQGQPQKSQITYRHLLTMTSGLKELNDLGRWEDYLSASVDHSPVSKLRGELAFQTEQDVPLRTPVISEISRAVFHYPDSDSAELPSSPSGLTVVTRMYRWLDLRPICRLERNVIEFHARHPLRMFHRGANTAIGLAVTHRA